MTIQTLETIHRLLKEHEQSAKAACETARLSWEKADICLEHMKDGGVDAHTEAHLIKEQEDRVRDLERARKEASKALSDAIDALNDFELQDWH